MTPLEMNKKIAKMKGFRISYEHNNSLKLCAKEPLGLEYTDDKDNTVQCLDAIMGPIINWAENISDTWKLFEEMPNPTLSRLKDNLCFCAVDISKKNEEAICATDKSFLLAICKAWIQWKENS